MADRMAEDAVLLDKSPFPPLQLTFEEQQHCHDVSLQLLERVLHCYDERLAGVTPRHHANLDSARWKLEKTQDNASMCDPGRGLMRAPLDEVMFGLAIPTIEAFKIRVSTLGNQDLGGAILAKLVGPTEEKPFQNLSVLYMTTELPWLVSKVVRPRDFVLLSASGVITTAAGERIGYDLLQPAPLSQCGPLPKPMIRGKYVFGALYRQLDDGSVDVYVQQYLEAMGNVFDSFAISSLWQGILGFFSTPVLSEHKKLQWYIARYHLNDQLTPSSDSSRDTNGSGPATWGLLYGDSVPDWSPTRSLSMSRESFDSFSWTVDP
ncbi:unnamed protein product [Phytophthora fragariaefolia]|uniref:Unnamed protein product n=1 Tax=Phytophthora fragariaefolia TaxID=1490495 RepID=A0A9W6YNJ3_9STRA|nr:unnamed protein product [Phytophthora fragariaefolia]